MCNCIGQKRGTANTVWDDISSHVGKTVTLSLWARYSGGIFEGQDVLRFDSISIK
jgi:hypothetical protein